MKATQLLNAMRCTTTEESVQRQALPREEPDRDGRRRRKEVKNVTATRRGRSSTCSAARVETDQTNGPRRADGRTGQKLKRPRYQPRRAAAQEKNRPWKPVKNRGVCGGAPRAGAYGELGGEAKVLSRAVFYSALVRSRRSGWPRYPRARRVRSCTRVNAAAAGCCSRQDRPSRLEAGRMGG